MGGELALRAFGVIGREIEIPFLRGGNVGVRSRQISRKGEQVPQPVEIGAGRGGEAQGTDGKVRKDNGRGRGRGSLFETDEGSRSGHQDWKI